MEYKELDFLAKRIYMGLSVVKYGDRLFFIYDPRPTDQLVAHFHYDTFYNNLLDRGVPSKQECIAAMVSKGVWSEEMAKELEDIDSDIERLEKDYGHYEFQRNKKLMIQHKIKTLRKRKDQLSSIIRKGIQHSAESLAEAYQNKYLLYKCTKDEDGNPCWKSFSDFRDSVKENMTIYLLRHSFYDDRLNEKNIRLVARKDPWRSIWLSSVKTGSLFPNAKSEMTDFQRVLVTWSIAYDNVYEHPECPDESIINDDDALDMWFAEQNDKRKSQQNNNNLVNKITKNKKIQNAEHVGIVVDSSEEATRVYNLNDKATMSNLKNREQFVKEKGRVKEVHMPDTKLELQMRRNQMEKEKIKNG